MSKSRSLVSYGVGFTLLVTLFFWFMLLLYGINPGISFILAAGWGLFTALLVACGYVLRHFMQRRAFRGKKQASASTDSRQQRTIEIDLPYDAAYALALIALHTLDGQRLPLPEDVLVRLESLLPRQQRLSLYTADRARGLIQAGLRTMTFGITDVVDFSALTIVLERVDAATTRLHLTAQPASVFGEYDLGKNLHYVNQLALYLRRESQPAQAAERLAVPLADAADDDQAAQRQEKRRG